ncbi:MAG: helix-turn-helix domain-containing protein [Mycobacterium sp.]|uniref:helix-turn-helix domain-containing protein n=1 Tax=Mycobacterium sp. TaxID=1785 RepID=UPI003C43FACF
MTEPLATTPNAGAKLLDVDQVAARLNVGRSTVFNLMSSNKLRSVKIGQRRLVSEASLAEFIEGLDRQADANPWPQRPVRRPKLPYDGRCAPEVSADVSQ